MNDCRHIASPQACTAMVRGQVIDPSLDLIEDGAVYVDQDRIIAVGPYAQLEPHYRPAIILGSRKHLVMPGLINAHDHVRVPSTVAMGIADDFLEPWIIDLARLPPLDPELVSTLAHCEMLEAGVTTVVNSFYQPSADAYDRVLAAQLRGAQTAGARAVPCLGMMDQSIVQDLIQAVQPDLPKHLQAMADAFLQNRPSLDWRDYEALIDSWALERADAGAAMMIGPVSVHWCSDALLERIWAQAQNRRMAIQTHLLESPYQRQTAFARHGRSAIAFMAAAGYLQSGLSCAHAVQVSDADIALLAAHGASVVHCPGSNQRLRNGVAPVPAMLRAGVNVALGLDSMTRQDDCDLISELAFAQALHAPSCLSASEVFAWATTNAAKALAMGDMIGALAVGKKADIVTIRPGPAAASADLTLPALLANWRGFQVDEVMVDGVPCVRNGRHIAIDKASLHAELAREIERAAANPPALHQELLALKPYLRRLVASAAGSA